MNLSDDIFTELKRIAAETQKPLKEVMEDALRSELQRRKRASIGRSSQQVITYRGNGLRLGINLDSAAELLDFMDDNPFRHTKYSSAFTSPTSSIKTGEIVFL